MLEDLSSREVDVLKLVAGGNSNKKIASRLFISVDTVKTHIQSIIKKLGARNRTHAVILAMKKD